MKTPLFRSADEGGQAVPCGLPLALLFATQLEDRIRRGSISLFSFGALPAALCRNLTAGSQAASLLPSAAQQLEGPRGAVCQAMSGAPAAGLAA